MDLREKFNVVTGRAVAPLDAQLEISAAFVAPRGYVLPMRNRGDLVSPKVLGELGLEMTDRVERELEPGVVRMFPMLKKVKKTPARFPRAWAIIKARPLS